MIRPAVSHSTARPPVTLRFAPAWLSSDWGSRASLGSVGISQTVINPLAFGYDPKVEGYSYDPKKAKELLKQAGFPNGTEITISNMQFAGWRGELNPVPP